MKKVLLFGFDALPEILAAAAAAKAVGAEAVPVSRESYGLSLGELAQGKTGTGGRALPAGKMVVFCGLERELDSLLAGLRQGGIVCMKAVLTPSNRSWTPGRLYQELELERRAMERGGRP